MVSYEQISAEYERQRIAKGLPSSFRDNPYGGFYVGNYKGFVGYRSSKAARLRALNRQKRFAAQERERIRQQRIREGKAISAAETFKGEATRQAEEISRRTGESIAIDRRIPTASRLTAQGGRTESFLLPSAFSAKESFIQQGGKLASSFKDRDIREDLKRELQADVKASFEKESEKIKTSVTRTKPKETITPRDTYFSTTPKFKDRSKTNLNVIENTSFPEAPLISYRTGGAELVKEKGKPDTFIKTKSVFINPDPVSGGSVTETGLADFKATGTGTGRTRTVRANPFAEIVRSGGKVTISDADIEQPLYIQNPQSPDFITVSYQGKKETIPVEGFRKRDQTLSLEKAFTSKLIDEDTYTGYKSQGVEQVTIPKNTIYDINITPPVLDYTLPPAGGKVISNITLPKEYSKGARYKITEIGGKPLGFSSPLLISKTTGSDTLDFKPIPFKSEGVLREATNLNQLEKLAGRISISASRDRISDKSFLGQAKYTLKFAYSDIVLGGSGVNKKEVAIFSAAGFAVGGLVGGARIATGLVKIPKTAVYAGNVLKYGGGATLAYFGGRQVLKEADLITRSPFPKVEGVKFTGRQLANIGGFAIGSGSAGLALETIKPKIIKPSGDFLIYEKSRYQGKNFLRINTIKSDNLVFKGVRYKDLQLTTITTKSRVTGFGRYTTAQGQVKTIDFTGKAGSLKFKSFGGDLFGELGYRQSLLTARGKTSTNLLFREGTFAKGQGKIINIGDRTSLVQVGKGKFIGERLAVSKFYAGETGDIFSQSFLTAQQGSKGISFTSGRSNILFRQTLTGKAPKIDYLRGKLATGKFTYKTKDLGNLQLVKDGKALAVKNLNIGFTRQPRELQNTLVTEFTAKAKFKLISTPKVKLKGKPSLSFRKPALLGSKGTRAAANVRLENPLTTVKRAGTNIKKDFTLSRLKPKTSTLLKRTKGSIPINALNVLSKPITTPKLFPLVRTRTAGKQVSKVITSPRLKPISALTPVTSQAVLPKVSVATKTSPVLKTSSLTGQTVRSITSPRVTSAGGLVSLPVTNIVPPPIPPITTVPFTPSFPFVPPAGFGRRKKGVKQKGKQYKRYTPTLTSFLFNIRGKSSKVGVRSGLGIRPIPI